jgi:hypothetical protein
MMPLEALLDPHSNKPATIPRIRAIAPRPRAQHHDHQQRTSVVASPDMPGWQIQVINAGLLDQPHTMIITTATGHHYLSRAPNPL